MHEAVGIVLCFSFLLSESLDDMKNIACIEWLNG